MVRIIHKYMGDTQWTLCGRYSAWIKGSMNIMASDKDHEVNCKACRSQIDEQADTEKQDK